MWSTNDVIPQIIQVGDFIICVKTNIVQIYYLCEDKYCAKFSSDIVLCLALMARHQTMSDENQNLSNQAKHTPKILSDGKKQRQN